MTEALEQEGGNEELWHTVFQVGHPDLKKQQWLHQKLPHEPRCRMCYSPFKGFGGWVQRTFRKRAPSNRNPHYCTACDAFINQFPGGAEIELSVLFIDIRESTQFATQSAPVDVSRRINRFLDLATKTITDNDGFIMAFYGDCVVAVWPPGFSGEDHAEKAIAAAQALTQQFAAFKAADAIPVGIGCHTGKVYMGTVSAAKGLFRDVSIFGEDVILTARLASTAIAFQALVSDQCWSASGRDGASSMNDYQLKGLEESVKAHALQSIKTS